MATLLSHLQALEVELHDPGVRCNVHRLEQLLHPGFCEVGRSGRFYDRETVIQFLSAQHLQLAVASQAFKVSEIGLGVALLTYRSAQIERDGLLVNHTLRSSNWVQTKVGWQLRYHQGTAAAKAW